MDDPPPPESATRDKLMGGRATLWQSADGYRAGMDAALLAAAVTVPPRGRALEAGCGPGAALVQAALRNPGTGFVGLERDLAALALARRNMEENGLADRTSVAVGDVGAGARAALAALGEPPFDAAFANPPFFDDESALRGPTLARRAAWIADDGLAAWATFLLDVVRDGGAVTVIHRADRLGDLLAALGGRGGSTRVRPVAPFADAPAKRVLVRAVRGGRAPLVLLPALVLHDRKGGRHTGEAEAILRGEAALGWE